MTPCAIIGIDPSLSATGIVLLRHVGDPGHWRVTDRVTVGASPKGSLAARLVGLSFKFVRALEGVIARLETDPLGWVPLADVLVVAEDPSDFRVPGKGGPSHRFKFGAGVGVVLAEAARRCVELGIPFETYGTKEWLPQSGRRGWRYNTPHDQVVAQAHRLIPGLEGATDDETMAAALAFWRGLRSAA